MPSTNDTAEPNGLHRIGNRVELLLVDEGVLMYEPGTPTAWLGSDASISLAERREPGRDDYARPLGRTGPVMWRSRRLAGDATSD